MTTVLPSPPSPARMRLSAHSDRLGRMRAWCKRHDGLVALLVYLALSLIWYRGVVTHMTSNCACGLAVDPGDNADFVWWLQWFVHALGHGLPLLHPTVIWAPTGINLAGTTASLLMGLLAAPLTMLWGPIAAYNAWMILGPVLSAWGANRLCRHITGSAPASLIAGCAFGFSSFEITHLVGHPQMVLMVLPPLIALLVIRLLDGTLTRRRFLACTSVLLVAQVLLSVEVTFTMTLAGALALLATWATGSQDQRRRLIRALPTIGLPWVIAGIATCWYTLQVLGAPVYATRAAYMYPTDLLAFLVPMPYTWLGGTALAGVSGHFLGGQSETAAYLGWPLLAILGHQLVTQRRARSTRTIAIVLAVLALWTLGPILWVDGHFTIYLPYRLLAHLPLLSETLLGRISVYLSLTAAVALAIWLSAPGGRRWLRWTCGALAVAALLPNLASPAARNVSTWNRPAFFYTSAYRHYLRRDESILPIPWGVNSESYSWQARDDMYWNMAGGYWMFAPPAGWSSTIARDLWLGTPRAGDGPRLRALLARRHVSAVVVLKGYEGLWSPTLHAAGQRVTASIGGVTVYHVRGAGTASGGHRHARRRHAAG